MNVVWSPEAVTDLEGITDYIAVDNPDRATTFVQEIVASGAEVGEMPRAFALVPRLEHRGIRHRVHGRYLLFYRIGAESVEMLRVVHGARDYVRALFPDVR